MPVNLARAARGVRPARPRGGTRGGVTFALRSWGARDLVCKAAGCASAFLGVRARRAARSPHVWRRSVTTSSSARGRSTAPWRPRQPHGQVARARRSPRVRRQRSRRRLRHRRDRHARGTRRRPRRRRTSSARRQGRVSMANALVRVGHEFQPLVPPRGSVAAHVQAAVPRCRVVAAFHHLPATELGHLGQPIDSDVLICGDDAAAVLTMSEIVGQDPRLPPARRRRAVERHGDRGVHRRAAAAERALQDPRRAEAHRNQGS
jgi:hypothetical protein